MSIKKSLFAKILIMILCLSLVLCGCSGAADSNDDKDDEKTSNQGDEIKNDDGNKNDGDKDDDEGDNKGNKDPATPEEMAEAAIGNTLNAIFGSNTDVGVLEDALECGKVTICVGDFVENVLYIDTNDFALADQLKLNIEGEELEAELYVNGDELVIAVPDILDGAYGVSFDTLATDLEDSLIWELMGVDYDELMGQLEGYLEELNGALEDMDPTFNDLAGTLEEVVEYVDCDIKEGTAEVNGEDVDAVIVTYTVTSDDFQEMLNVLLEWFEGYVDGMGLDDMLEGTEMEDFTESIVELKDELNSFFEDGTVDVELVATINADTGYIMTVDAAIVAGMDGEEASTLMNINLGEDLTKSNEYTLTVSGVTAEESIDLVEIVLERDSDGSEISYNLGVYAYDEEVLSISFVYDSDSYEYTLGMDAEGSTVAIEGTFKLTDDEFEFSLDYIEVDDQSMDIGLVISVEAVSSSKIPDAPKYKNILTMSEDEWTEVLNILGAFFG